jgi:hypothetical protein
VTIKEGTVWLPQKQLCELFGRDRTVITMHVNNVCKEGELDRDSVSAKLAHAVYDKKTYQINCMMPFYDSESTPLF